ncbi:heme transporter hrg1-A-like [Portunus trituberculatus]|uniref:heme transporter hrg1-A-like n=1 Tax=Portunus trituberculatus TaxID=210409 RepID=UPI001E1CC638|nr:heme transporter hrg1-A-like [Portunus trituberculatus]XP_045129485.1 heme transporter hrg1-A-like [Portunus trituberculatus]
MARRGGCCMYFNIISAVLGALAGLSAFVVFFFHFENRQAGMWAFVSGVFASTTLFIHILYKRHSLEMWYTPENLQQIRLLGFLGFIAGLAGMIAYLAIAASVHEDMPSMENISSNHYFMAIWAFLTLKWGASLFGFSHLYRKRLLEEYHPLLA